MTCNQLLAQNMLSYYQVASLTFEIPYAVILTLHHRLQSDYNFQDLGYDLLQKPSAPTAFNDFFVSQTRL